MAAPGISPTMGAGRGADAGASAAAAARLRRLESAVEHLAACRRELDDYRARGMQLAGELEEVAHAA